MFIWLVEQRSSERELTPVQAFRVFEENRNKQMSSFWTELSRTNGNRFTPKFLHDFYHNTFSKQFCSDFNLVKERVRTYLDMNVFAARKDAVAAIMDMLRRQYPENTYHYQTVYQFVNHIFKRRGLEPRPSAESEPGNSAARPVVEKTPRHNTQLKTEHKPPQDPWSKDDDNAASQRQDTELDDYMLQRMDADYKYKPTWCMTDMSLSADMSDAFPQPE